MARIVFENLTMKQAETFADWFEGQGEQDCVIWFDAAGVDSPSVNVHARPWKKKEGDTITVQCQT